MGHTQNNAFWGVIMKNDDTSVVQMNCNEHWNYISLNFYDPWDLTY
jgi:hypothetical protein